MSFWAYWQGINKMIFFFQAPGHGVKTRLCSQCDGHALGWHSWEGSVSHTCGFNPRGFPHAATLCCHKRIRSCFSYCCMLYPSPPTLRTVHRWAQEEPRDFSVNEPGARGPLLVMTVDRHSHIPHSQPIFLITKGPKGVPLSVTALECFIRD